jgi:hypothetical protein
MRPSGLFSSFFVLFGKTGLSVNPVGSTDGFTPPGYLPSSLPGLRQFDHVIRSMRPNARAIWTG